MSDLYKAPQIVVFLVIFLAATNTVFIANLMITKSSACHRATNKKIDMPSKQSSDDLNALLVKFLAYTKKSSLLDEVHR